MIKNAYSNGIYRGEYLSNGYIRVYNYACQWATLHNYMGVYYSGGGGDNPELQQFVRDFIRFHSP